ncbi:hypothetical protein ES319_D09G002200v1 [Gossypium barbadense]|uniref:Uncharacterized protein n=2 Tax=Gossypium TaxID=3633 RepID=A0A5J5PXC6_GOSBA|nr:hypothetical protein ES319_D09G002200v1 [Gossypium barbadense]TYG52118.1 hypothetical protein ES288_D09G002600v1 [Gossypium darwinii]
MVKLHIWVFIILIYLLDFGYGDAIEVPPLNINQKELMKHLSLVDIKIALPVIYVFSDSFFDNGNNKTILGNKDASGGGCFPFGIDFDGKPTGRVTNGRIGVDFIATVAGLPYPPPIMGILYTLGARKFFVSNVSPLGCSPFNINTKNHSGPCVEEIKNCASVYNDLLVGLLAKLQSTLHVKPRSYGFKDVNTSCCIDNNGTRIQVCAPNIAPYKDRKNHVFFDPFHPSETMHFFWARRFLKDSSVCSPINLIQLMQA